MINQNQKKLRKSLSRFTGSALFIEKQNQKSKKAP